MIPNTGKYDIYDDDSLIGLVQKGIDEAFDTLWRRHRDWIRQYVGGFAIGGIDVDDLVQESCIKILNAIPTYRSPSHFTAWARTISRNTSLDFIRRCKREMNRRVLRPEIDGEVREIPDCRYDPFDVVHAKYLRSELVSAVRGLPEIHQETIRLRYFEQSSLSQIAEVMDCPVGTVKSRLHNALVSIRDSLGRRQDIMEVRK